MGAKRNRTGDVITLPGHKGKFIVISTAMTGGGTGHGPGDVYPDAHQLTMLPFVRGKVQNDARKIQRYQDAHWMSGSIPYQEPVKKMRVRLIYEARA